MTNPPGTMPPLPEPYSAATALGLDNLHTADVVHAYAKSYAALASKPAEPVAPPARDVQANNDVDLLLRQVFELCEETEGAPEVEPKNEHQRGYDRGRRFEAKSIRRAIGTWFQDTFCGRSFMGEPALSATTPAPAGQDEEWAEALHTGLSHLRADAASDYERSASPGYKIHDLYRMRLDAILKDAAAIRAAREAKEKL